MQQTYFAFHEKLKLPTIDFNHTLYASLSEAKCARALQEYVYGWKPIFGKTVQVDIHNCHRVDFRVGSSLVEFHPITPWRDIASTSALSKFSQLHERSTKEDRALLREALELEYEMQYRKLRRAHIDSCRDPELRKCKLIHVKNEVEFYARVLAPYAKCKLPSPLEWLEIWRENRV